jgi:disulfide bond formation protein DsbB
MSQRQAYILSFLTIAIILGTGVYLEYFQGIMPCPLCTLQRICFGACGIFFLLGIFLYRKACSTMVINVATILISFTGMLLAGRQIWIQYFPSADTSSCGVSINYMLSVLPWQDVASRIFSGSTECSQRGWELLGLNIPEWSILFFALFFISSVYYLIRAWKQGCKARG